MSMKESDISSENCLQLSLVDVQRARNVISNPQTEIILKAMDEMKRGILIVPPPTGIGKSHGVTHAFIQAWIEGKRLWFITARKNNLKEPIENLEKEAQRLYERGTISKQDYQDLVDSTIPLNNYVETWEPVLKPKNNYISEMRKSKLFNNEDFKPLLKTLKKSYDKYTKNKYPEEASRYMEEFYDSERAVRKFVKNDLKEFAAGFKEDGTKRTNGTYSQDIIDAYVEKNPWIKIVYPYININKCYNGRYPIVFATEAKKNLPCDNLMGDSACLYAQIRSKGGVVVIDEIDQSKVDCREQLLKQDVYNKFKIVDLIKKNFTRERLEMIINAEKDEAKRKKMEDRLVTNRKLIDDFETRFSPVTTLREFSEECQEAILSHVHIIMETSNNKFHSDGLTYGSKGTAAYIDIVPIKDKNGNAKNETNSEEVVWLRDAVSGLTGIITHFVVSLPYFLESLNVKRNHSQDSPYDYSNIASLLHALNIEDKTDEFDYLIKRLMSKGSINIKKMPVINSLYSKGLNISIPRLADYDSERNTMDCFSVDISPEEILATIADSVLVIGLSASADIGTVIGNYNYEWIQSCNIPVCSLSEEDWEKIKETQKGRFANIDKVDFNVKEMNEENANCMLSTETILMIEDIANKATKENKDPSYEFKRLVKMAAAFKYFSDEGHVAGIVLTQRDYGKTASLEKSFKKLFESIDPDVDIYFTNSEKMKEKWDNARSSLSEGKRIFFIAPYQSGNTGLNYNYPLSREYWESCQVADAARTYSEKIDVDFIYLSGITNVFPIQEEGKGFDRAILAKQVYIIEELYQHGEISSEKRAAYINLCMEKGKISLEEQISWPSYQGEILKILIQSMGRIERSPYKRLKASVLYDSALTERVDAEYIKAYLTSRTDLNPHTEAFLEVLADSAKDKGAAKDHTETRLSNCSTDAQRYINLEYGEIRRGNLWYPEKIMRYESLHEFVLKHPTAEAEDFEGCEWIKEFYLKNDFELYYAFLHGNIQIRKTDVRGYKKLTSDVSNLDDLMKNAQIKAYFEEHEYAVSWDETKKYIMSPGLMTNIYMGAIGEESLKALLSKECIETITNADIYELYDFICNRVPIDAKNYTPEAYPGGRAPDLYDPKKQLRVMAFKLDKTNAEAAAYVNLIDDGERKEGETLSISGTLLNDKKTWERPVLVIRGLITRDGTVKKTEMSRLIKFIEDHEGAIDNYKEAQDDAD